MGKINIQTWILMTMAIVYTIPIIYISYIQFRIENAKLATPSSEPRGGDYGSISTIMSSAHSEFYIKKPIFVMCFLAITYEYLRICIYSLGIMSSLIFGLLGVINTDESMISHYVFATIVCISIMVFMMVHRFSSNLCCLLFCINVYFGIKLCLNLIQSLPILFEETAFLLNFAIYYISLHCIEQ